LWERLKKQHNITVEKSRKSTHGKAWQASCTTKNRGRGRFETGGTIESAGGDTEEAAVFDLILKLKLTGWQNIPAGKRI
jgi:hypothetical protein